jgi:hypothetical protein
LHPRALDTSALVQPLRREALDSGRKALVPGAHHARRRLTETRLQWQHERFADFTQCNSLGRLT